MKRHTYVYVGGRKTDYGHQDRLRRDDGKLVYVGRKRLNQLHDRGQLLLPKHGEPTSQFLARIKQESSQ